MSVSARTWRSASGTVAKGFSSRSLCLVAKIGSISPRAAPPVGHGGKCVQLAERVLGGVPQLDLASRGALERVAGPDPQRVHGFRGIVRGLLTVWRGSDE